MDDISQVDGQYKYIKPTNQNYPIYLQELLKEINTTVGQSFGGASPYQNLA
jgi:hypothetical protein